MDSIAADENASYVPSRQGWRQTAEDEQSVAGDRAQALGLLMGEDVGTPKANDPVVGYLRPPVGAYGVRDTVESRTSEISNPDLWKPTRG